MKNLLTSFLVGAVALQFLLCVELSADPCGMVPPVYEGSDPPILRVGLQKTYVFHADGVEAIVIRPGFSGKVDQFGMLIPFPSVPSLRKAHDNIFQHVAAAIDPPEVVIDLRPQLRGRMEGFGGGGFGGGAMAEEDLGVLKRDEVRVIKEEAVGMYEVAVLAAGSAKALKKWMVQNGFRYPLGMDKVTEEYIAKQWCFVAVKTKVAEKEGVDAKPGQRSVDANMEKGSSFDGHVQAMGFRFATDELVVPMRLSTFNEGDSRNVVYILTDSPQKIRNIPQEYVVRQISGEQLLANITEPLPLRVIGEFKGRLPAHHRRGLAERRDPEPKNGLAKTLFAADLRSSQTGKLSLPYEDREKELVQINELFGLRGPEVDTLTSDVVARQEQTTNRLALNKLKRMTMTVIDGDFPREILQREDLTFAEYKIPGDRNNAIEYDAKLYGAGTPTEGKLIEIGMREDTTSDIPPLAANRNEHSNQGSTIFTLIGISVIVIFLSVQRVARKEVQPSGLRDP